MNYNLLNGDGFLSKLNLWFWRDVYYPIRNRYYEYAFRIFKLSREDMIKSFKFEYALLALGVFLVVLTTLLILIRVCKKKKVIFYDGKTKVAKIKVKHKQKILYPEIKDKQNLEFVGWFKDKKFKKQYRFTTLVKNKKLKLYAKFNEVEGLQNNQLENAYKNDVGVSSVVEEKILLKGQLTTLSEFYDAIRYEMLSYERAIPFKQLGVVRKQVVAEMFERDNKINVYFAVDTNLMKEKGYNVSEYTEPEFQIVPCKKIVETFEDYEETLKLIKEAMLLNNFIKSDIVLVKKTFSDENARKSGFAFYVKNEVIATSASEYYKLLRAVVLSYKLSGIKKFPQSLDNKMILKIFKKGERIFLYLALSDDSDGLEFVGYDKNFADTPFMFEVKTAEDLTKANSLIDKLMYRFGMEKYPEQVEVSADEVIDENCGFGYRIRR